MGRGGACKTTDKCIQSMHVLTTLYCLYVYSNDHDIVYMTIVDSVLADVRRDFGLLVSCSSQLPVVVIVTRD